MSLAAAATGMLAQHRSESVGVALSGGEGRGGGGKRKPVTTRSLISNSI